jgi:hypothetical protein
MPSRKSKHQKHNPCPNDDHVKFALIVSSIGNIRDQSLCGDCWAVSASSSFSDRRCIQRAKQGQPIDPSEDNFFSAYDTAVCSDGAGGDDASVAHFLVTTCQRIFSQFRCKGGSTAKAWRWYTNTVGICSFAHRLQLKLALALALWCV